MSPLSKSKAAPFLAMRSIRSPLIGRDHELEIVANLFEQIAVDQGQILGLVAPAGMGKTRMLLAIAEMATQQSLPVYRGTFTQNYLPYEAFRQIVAQLTGSDTDTLSRWDLSEAEVDYLRLFLEPDAEIDRLKNLSESEIQQGLFYSVKKLIFSAAKTPTVFILEDAHWAGEHSKALLEYLIDQTETTRILLIVSHRPDVEFDWKRRLNHTDIKLKPLEKIQIERFVRNVLDIDHLDTRVIHELVRVSHGNPLFLEEMLKHMLQTGQIEIETETDGARTLLLRTNAEGMPASLQTLIESRISRLPEQAREALRWTTTLGNIGDTDELLAFLKERLGEVAETSLSTLFKEGLIAERSAFPKRTYQFQHDLFFEVSEHLISEKDRRGLQKNWGDFLRRHLERDLAHLSDRVARHYLASDDEVSAIHFALQAGKMALRYFHYTDALYYLQEAFIRSKRTYVPDINLNDLYAPLTETMLATGKLLDSKEVLERWNQNLRSPTPEEEARYLKCLVQHHDQNANHDEILQITDEIKRREHESPAFNRLYLETAHSRINAFVYKGRYNHAVHEGLEILRVYTAPECRSVRMRIWGRLAYCSQVRRKPLIGLDFVEKAEEYFNDQIPPLQQIELMFRIKNVYGNLSLFDPSRKIFSQMLDIAKRYGLRRAYTEILQGRAELLFSLGLYSMGLQDATVAMRESKEMKDFDVYFDTKLVLIDHLLDIGAIDRAKSLWLQKEPEIPKYDIWQAIRNLHIQAIFALMDKNYPKALRLFELIKGEKKYSQAVQHVWVSRLYSVETECIHQSASAEVLRNEFLQLAHDRSVDAIESYRSQKIAVGFCLGAHGIDVLTPDEEKTEPRDCTLVDKKQRLYVWKILWLEAKARQAEADALREEYKKVREQIAMNIPQEHRLDFMTHPLYRVP